MRSPTRTFCALTLAATLLGAGPASGSAEPFDQWLAELRSEALASGLSPATVDRALDDVQPDPDVIALDRKQPGTRLGNFCRYLDLRLTDPRVARARRLLAEHSALLADLEADYGVPPRYLVALWGLETNFGSYQGGHDVIRSLATLAHDARRADLFRTQLLAALKILDEGHLERDDMKGSWAGAMGQVQFMPTTFIGYAVDGDGDGRKDIWNSVPDALASAANYLDQSGWKRGQSWGRRVRLPKGLRIEGRSTRAHSISEWSRRGVRRYDGRSLPRANMTGRVVLPMRRPEPAFLVYPNYQAILAWNRSTFFGISVGTLADRITRRGDRICSL